MLSCGLTQTYFDMTLFSVQVNGEETHGPNGEETHKVRYVAKGYSQIAKIDYQETFAPTARMSSVRMLMQRVVQNNMITHQMDVKTAYLNAPIDCDCDLGELSWFLGTEFKCSDTNVEMGQVDKVLSKFEMVNCKPKSTPCALGVENESEVDPRELSDPRMYQAIVGSLIYVMTGTRPDLCYIVTILSQNMAKPTESDLSMAKYVLRYLKGTREQGLKFGKSESPL